MTSENDYIISRNHIDIKKKLLSEILFLDIRYQKTVSDTPPPKKKRKKISIATVVFDIRK